MSLQSGVAFCNSHPMGKFIAEQNIYDFSPSLSLESCVAFCNTHPMGEFILYRVAISRVEYLRFLSLTLVTLKVVWHFVIHIQWGYSFYTGWLLAEQNIYDFSPSLSLQSCVAFCNSHPMGIFILSRVAISRLDRVYMIYLILCHLKVVWHFVMHIQWGYSFYPGWLLADQIEYI